MKHAVRSGRDALALCLIVAIVAVCGRGAVAAGEAAIDDGLLFHASFDEGIDADHAAGSGQATVSGDRGSEIKRVPGLVGHGVLVGAPDSHLTYVTEGNLDAERGTLALWYQPVGWGPKKPPSESPSAEGWQFKRWWFASGNVSIHQRYHAGWLSQPRTSFNLRPAYKDVNRWRYVVVTWDRTIPETTVYADVHHVRPNTTKEAIAAMKFGPTMEIGNVEDNGDAAACDKIIDEVHIWNRQLGPEEIAHQYRRGIRLRTKPRADIRRTRGRIRIDGVLEEAEWANATVIGGLINAGKLSLSTVPTRFLFVYDDENLYVGMHSDIPAEARASQAEKLLYGMVKDDVTRHDAKVDDDDSVRLHIWEPDQSTLYRLRTNSIGITADDTVAYGPGADGALVPAEPEPAWEPKWTTKSVVDINGWHMEAAIPFAALKIQPTDGRELKLDLARIWKKLRQQDDHWAVGLLDDRTGKSEPVANLGTLVLAGDETVTVEIVRFNVSPIDHDVIEFAARIRNQCKTQKQLVVGVQIDRHPATTRQIRLPPGEVFDFESTQQFARINDALEFRVADAPDPDAADAGDAGEDPDAADAVRVWYRQTIPIYSPHKLSIHTRQYLTEKVMSVYWRLAQMSAPLTELRGSVRVLRESDGRVVLEKLDIPFETEMSRTDVSTRALRSGRYSVETLVQHGDRIVARVATPLDLKVAEDFPWYGDDLGVPTEVPPPWTPMTWDEDADSVSCWGREMRYARKLLPTEIVNQGQPMLAAAMQLELRTAEGDPVRFGAADATVEWRQRSEVEMHSERRETLDSVEIRIESRAEFDGFVWMDLTVSPRGSEPVSVAGLSLVAPLDARWARLINVSDYSNRRHGAMPDTYAGNLGATWIGNGLGGIQFLCENTAPWALQSPHKCLTIHREGEVATVRINLIDHAQPLIAARTFSFGFMVTPVKPRPKDYRRWIIGPKNPAQAYDVLGRKGGIYLPLYVQGWSKLHRHDFDGHPLAENYPSGPFPAELRAVDVETPGGGARKDVCLYVAANRVPADSPEHEHWVDEWVVDATKHALIDNGFGPRLCPGAPSLIDWRVWGMTETMKVLGNRGYYFDVGFPQWCNNTHHGCGVLDREGTLHPTWSMLPHRRFLKRLYVALKAQNPDAIVTYHSSGTAYMPIYSFCDLLLDGENYYGSLNTTDRKSYEKFLTLETFRAQHLGHNFGAVSALLPQFRRRGSITYAEAEEIFKRDGEVRPYNYLIGLILLHDAVLWPSYMWAGSGCYEYSKLLGELNFDDRYEFMPYWSQKVVTFPENVVASFYVDAQTRRVLMVLMNVDDGEDRRLTLDMDWESLGIDPAKASVRNALHKEPVNLLPGGALEVPAPTRTYRLFVIEEGD